MEAAVPGSTAGQGISAWQLLVTSATPTLIVCILCAVGAAMAHKGVLNAAGCQVVAKLGFFVFTPALTFSKLAQAVSVASIAHLWPLLLNMTISIVVGLGVGLVMSRLLRTPPEFRVHVLVAIAFGNVGNLPLVFVSTLCHDRRAVFYRSLGEDCEHLGVAYTAFDIAAATIWQFTLAINLIRRGAAKVATAGDGLDDPTSGGAADHLPVSGQAVLRKEPTLSDLLAGRRGSRPGSANSSPRPLQQHQQGRAGSSPLGAAPASPPSARRSSEQLHVVELQPVAAPAAGAAEPAGPQLTWQQQGQHHVQQQGQQHWHASDSEEDTAALLSQAGGKGRGSGWQAAAAGQAADGSSARQLCAAAWRQLRGVQWAELFPMPTQAAIAGTVVGCIPAVKALLYGQRAPLRVLGEALETLGSGLIPVSIPLLGAVLYRGPGASRLPARVTLGVLLTRLVIQPALLTGLVVAALALRLFVPPDPMFLLTLLLSNATPTAINMQTLTVLYRYSEAEMSTILFWQYLAAVLTLPAFMWLFLRIIDAWL